MTIHQPTRSTGAVRLTVMSYNIQSGFRTAHNPTRDPDLVDLEPIIEVIRREDPDIVALQEVDRFRARTRYEDQAAYIASALGMEFAFGPAFYGEETEVGRGMYGNALLSKFPIESALTHALPGRFMLLPDEPAWVIEPRVALETRLRIGETAVYVYALHLSTTGDQQQVQVQRLLSVLDQVKGPQIVMGDFNAEPHTPHMQQLLEKLHSPLEDVQPRATFPNGPEATRAIDYILLSPDFRVTKAYVIAESTGASDHNPIVAHVELAQP